MSHLKSVVRMGFLTGFAASLFAVSVLGETQPKSKSGVKPAEQTPIAVHEHEVEGVQVALLEAKRNTDNTVTVSWRYTNTSDEPKELQHGYSVGMDVYRFARDAYLSANDTKYVVLEDEKGTPVAAKHNQFQFSIKLKPGQSVATWGKFSAPPQTVETVTIYLPGSAPFDDVQVKTPVKTE